MKKIFFIVLFFLIISLKLEAQEVDDSISTSQSQTALEKIVSPSIIKLTGEAGFYGELYSISGRERRRPAQSGRIFFRPTLTLFENFSINFDIFLSTEGNDARQQINQIGLHPEWGWGKAHIGDFTHEFSKLSLNGITIRGGGIELYPGLFRFQVIGGQTQRAVQAGPYNSSFSRYIGAIKIGYGKTGGSFVDLNFIKVKDNTASLPKDMFIRDSSITTTGSQYGITPQENLVAGINTEIRLFDNMINFSGEAVGCAFTRDMFSSAFSDEELKDADLPTFINDIYKLRLSTNADFAYSTELGFNYDFINTKLGYSVINPGFTSLGLGSLINDRRNMAFNTGMRFFKNNLSVQANFQLQDDNLLNQKLNTTTRLTYGASVNVRPIKELSVVLNTMRNTMENDSKNDTVKVNNVNSTYSVNLMLQLQLLGMNNSFAVSYSNQLAEDMNIFRKGNNVTSQNFTFAVTTMAGLNWSFSPSVSFNAVDIQNRSNTSTSTYNFRINNKMLNSKLSNALTLGYMDASSIKSKIITLQSGFSVTSSDNVSLTIRSAFYTGVSSTSVYQEHKANLNFTHRF